MNNLAKLSFCVWQDNNLNCLQAIRYIFWLNFYFNWFCFDLFCFYIHRFQYTTQNIIDSCWAWNEVFHLVKFYKSNKLNFSIFINKFFAIGLLNKNFHEVILTNLPVACPDSTPWTKNNEKQQKAWGYMILALKKTPTSLIQSITIQNLHAAWTILTNWYTLFDTDVYKILIQAFEMSVLQDSMDNSKPWNFDLIMLNAWIGASNANYKKLACKW